MAYVYRADQELPVSTVEWLDNTGATRDFSAGWTFTAKVCAASAATTVLLSKTTGITGAATLPNITIAWSTTDFSGLSASETGAAYVCHLYARRTADTKDDVFSPGKPISFTLLTAPA